ncbi:PEP-CTERM sorting domain-containing protein [Phenylobacterium sp.]|uniref:PEP-CTERM sorting domain-containing protein n=1 Tax=Phenylobacterium sp. TaxID=1871053 RepID=UPI002C7B8C43|nr:PEP-CTERM sorting domain-containing protein [Phenylobacterium sp.]HLZ76911.1 PEP-CTERM sorting domain-containing protein [Phenylobacterium sp.]
MSYRLISRGLALASTLLAVGASGSGASAATIQYIFTVTGSGDFSNDGALTSFTGLTAQLIGYGDTTTLVDDPGVARVVHLTSGTVSYTGGPLEVLTTDAGATFAVFEGASNSGLIGNGDFSSGMFGGTFTLFNGLFSSALAGYDAVSSTGPVSVSAVDQFLGFPWKFEAPTNAANDYIDFYSVSSATFQANRAGSAAPEPGAWALMLLGFGGLGAMLRRRRVVPA